jgi:hypothetical protein
MNRFITCGMDKQLHRKLVGKRVSIGPAHTREGLVVGTSIYGTARVKFGGEKAYYQTFPWDQLKEIV